MAIHLQIRRGTAAEWSSTNPVLLPGELGMEVDTGKFKAGDGTTSWDALSYSIGADGVAGLTGPTGPSGPIGQTGPSGPPLAGTFSISVFYKNPIVDDFSVWIAAFDCTVTAIKAYQDIGTGSTINAFGGSLASPVLFRSSNLATASADLWADGGAPQNVDITTGTAIYFRVVAVNGSPNEIGIQLNFTRP